MLSGRLGWRSVSFITNATRCSFEVSIFESGGLLRWNTIGAQSILPLNRNGGESIC